MENETSILRFRGPWGVPIEIAPSVLFLVGLIVMVNASAAGAALADGVILAVILVLSILLHELGHAWGAMVQGVRVDRIVLHGGGGFCRHAAAGARASELIVAMGPIVNLGLWAVLSLGAEAIWFSMPDPTQNDPYVYLYVAEWLWFAAHLNLMLFALNLIPVQPLDGGKLLHLGLLRVMSEARALQVAGAVGLVCALVWLPAMIVMFVTFGFVLLFLPNIAMHWHMVRGGRRLDRLRRR
ncbi:site-2 protease family protein [uncultured Tateyamaria sp.]|uniref:site-2 protease family protein n=1 Tax=uncultured Tateyamaria sp. TaxID=455651 RepID=UPI0026044C0C|nr:site-2 protease family protein [uncultured Tateyamaria sp.]